MCMNYTLAHQFKPFIFIVVLLIYGFNIPSSFGQLQEVGAIGDFEISEARQLNNGVLITKDNAAYLTKDFQNFRFAASVNSLMGNFSLNDTSYLLLREQYSTNPKFIIRLDKDLEQDTLLTFNGAGSGDFELLNRTKNLAFFTLQDKLYRYNKRLNRIQRITTGQAAYRLLTSHPQTAMDKNVMYLTDSNFYKLSPADTSIKKAQIDFHRSYPDFRLYPRLKVPWGILCVFADSSSGKLYSALTNGDTMRHIHPVPQWPDTSFEEENFTLSFYEWWGRSWGFRDRVRYEYGRSIATKEEANRKRTRQSRWCYFDTLSKKLVFSSSKNNNHTTLIRKSRLFKVKDQNLAFSYLDGYGFELLKVNSRGSELIRDVFPGMASGILAEYPYESFLQTDKYLFFTATHPYHGRSLFRTDGSTEGTGILAAPGILESWGNLTLFHTEQWLYVYKPSEEGKIYRVKKDADFIEEKYTGATNRHWNQSIYPSLYKRMSVGGGQLFRSRMKYKNGLIMATTPKTTGSYRFFPEARVALPYNRNTYPYGTMNYGVWDTTGRLLVPGFVSNQGGYTQATVSTDSLVSIFFKHQDESITNFDTVRLYGQHNLLRTYALQGDLKWTLQLPPNINALDMISDTSGNIYLSGIYYGGSLELSNGTLNSKYKEQSFITKVNTDGKLDWAINMNDGDLRNLSNLNTLHFDERRDKLYYLCGEGSFNVSSSCKYSNWLARVSQINAANGDIGWSRLIENTDLAEYYGLTTTDNGDVWVAGKFRGELIVNDEVREVAQGDNDCPNSGLLLGLDAHTGIIKHSAIKPSGGFADVYAARNHLYTVWFSTDRVIDSDLDYPKSYHALSIEKRSLDGKSKAEYLSPVKYSIGEPFFDFSTINDREDWLLFSANLDRSPIADSLYVAGRSLSNWIGSSLLMRRTGKIFKNLEKEQAAASGNASKSSFSIYPNPAPFHEVFVRAPGRENTFTRYRLNRYDGQFVASGTMEEDGFPQKISFRNNLSGLFILHLSGNGKPQTFKLILD